jgi:hypothetical protein
MRAADVGLKPVIGAAARVRAKKSPPVLSDHRAAISA